jgi:hypothetical protein
MRRVFLLISWASFRVDEEGLSSSFCGLHFELTRRDEEDQLH